MTGEPDDALLARYLVGTCSEAEKARVEEAFFADDAMFERMHQIEEDLIERHLRGELNETERDAFGVAYAAPARRERVTFARALQRFLRMPESGEAARSKVITQTSFAARRWLWTRRPSGFGAALVAAAAVVAMVGALAFAWRANGLRSTLQSIQADNDVLWQEREADRRRIGELENRAATLVDELNRERANRPAAGDAPPARSLVATFVLSPGLLRGTRAPARLLIRPSIDEARLQLDLEPGIDAERFRAEVRDNESRILWTQDGIKATPTGAGGAVVLTLPASVLQAGEYEVVLLGTTGPDPLEEIARYFFAVTRE
jgi:hypothetical protein